MRSCNGTEAPTTKNGIGHGPPIGSKSLGCAEGQVIGAAEHEVVPEVRVGGSIFGIQL